MEALLEAEKLNGASKRAVEAAYEASRAQRAVRRDFRSPGKPCQSQLFTCIPLRFITGDSLALMCCYAYTQTHMWLRFAMMPQ